MKVFGYVLVSSIDQNENHQVIALRQLGVREENIYEDGQRACEEKSVNR